jgi:hypothetical protein
MHGAKSAVQRPDPVVVPGPKPTIRILEEPEEGHRGSSERISIAIEERMA